jgi:two-component system, OmpR family, response regulator
VRWTLIRRKTHLIVSSVAIGEMTRLTMTASEQAEGEAGPRILLVDDEPRIRDFISRALDTAGYTVDAACSGTEGLRQAMAGSYDLIILDLIMPDMDGRQFLTQLLRERHEQGVLVLSCLADVTTKVDCLELGAQDYLTKPFSLAELLARVRVRLRGDAHPLNEVLKSGDLVLDVGRLEANIGNGPVALTRLEFLLLRELMEHAGQSVGKGQLLASVWGYDFDPGSNVVDVCVRRLRSKLGFDRIKTVRGEGYRLAS